MAVLKARVGGAWITLVGTAMPSDAAPQPIANTAAPGTSPLYSRTDHVHSSDKLPRGYVGHVKCPSATTSIVATVIDMVGATVTWTADPTRRYKTTLLTARFDQAATGGNVWVQLTDGANAQKGSGNQSLTLPLGGYGILTEMAVESGLSGSQTRKGRIRTDAGSLTLQAGTLLLVEDIGGI